MRPDVDIGAVAEGPVSRMPGVRLVGTDQEALRFRLAGPFTGRSLLVEYRPPRHPSYDYLVTLEEDDGSGPREVPTPPLLASSWLGLYDYALGWLVPPEDWPGPTVEVKVTKRMAQVLPIGQGMRCLLDLSGPLPDDLQGYYRRPGQDRGVMTAPEARVLEQLRAWVAMGWRVRGL